ncbi:hypothetical protein PMIN06_012162 [Paraphaeosphaeria minitans]
MDRTRETSIPDSLVDAEGVIYSDVEGDSWPEAGPAEMQDTDLLGNREAVDGNQASGCAGQATDPCLPEHTVALVATQTGENPDQAMDQALEPELSEASFTAAITASTSYQEPEARTTQSTSSSHQATSANEPEGEKNAQEGDIQHVARELGLNRAHSIVKEQGTANNELKADHQDDQADGHVTVTSLTKDGACTTITSPIPHTASHLPHTINEGVAYENMDLTSSSSEDEEEEEVSESIIVNTNGRKVIVISDDEMEIDKDKSPQTPRCQVQRKRVPPRSKEMVDWTSREYGKRSAASLAAAWKTMLKQWGKVHTQCDRRLAQILDPFHDEVFFIQKYELWNDKYQKHSGDRAYRVWVGYGIEKRIQKQVWTAEVRTLVHDLGKVVRQLREVEEEHLSIMARMNDGDSKDCDYMPAPARRHRTKKSKV